MTKGETAYRAYWYAFDRAPGAPRQAHLVPAKDWSALTVREKYAWAAVETVLLEVR